MSAVGQELLFPLPGNVCPSCSGMLESGCLTISSWVNAALAVSDFLLLFSMRN